MSLGPAELDPTRVSESATLSAGTLVLDGRFRVVRLLGGGGMGLVYLAEQVSLGRQVALKVLREDLPIHANMAERFRREALLLSTVDHPAVVRIIDFGLAGSSACIVMEYVEGESFEAVLQREAPLPVERAERLLTQLAQGLGAIHAKGIVHRDLKPDNIVLTRTVDGVEQARVLDFGIARFASVEGDGDVTQAGVVLGTPEYLSPEQALGQPLDARSDLYSLGVIASRLLSGRHPFPGPSAQQFVTQHVHQAPTPLVEAAPHLAAFPHLVNLVGACLAKAPADRPQSSQAFIDALTVRPMLLVHTLSQSNLAVPNPGTEATRQRNVALMVAGLALVVLGCAAALGVYFSQPERRARRLVEAGRGPEALQVIEDAGERGLSWAMKMLKATALHQVNRHEEEWQAMQQVPDGLDLEPVSIRSLADDYGRFEPVRVRRILAGLPRSRVLPLLQSLAGQEQSWAQWGALRVIDAEYAGQGLPLLELYAHALEGRDCRVRAVAAKRLAELRNPDALAPLKKLKELPRKSREDECGQEAAAAALTRLEKDLTP